MSGIKKYVHVAQITWKSMIIYRADTWLGVVLVGVRVLVFYLLWSAVFNGRAEVGGYSLPMMVTYALASTILVRLQHQDAMAWQFANEVREGTFSKYLVYPVSVVGYFVGSGLGLWSYLVIVNVFALMLWAGVFSHWLVVSGGVMLLWLLIIIPLGALCMLLLNHTIASFSLKFLDIFGFMILKNSMIEFLSGALIPLSMLPTGFSAVLRYTPFYYIVYYPVTLVLGRQTEPPWTAAGVLLLWCGILFVISQVWFFAGRKNYEGVGI